MQVGNWINLHDPEQYVYDNYTKCVNHLVGGTRFENTNPPPGYTYVPWTIDELLNAAAEGHELLRLGPHSVGDANDELKIAAHTGAVAGLLHELQIAITVGDRATLLIKVGGRQNHIGAMAYPTAGIQATCSPPTQRVMYTAAAHPAMVPPTYRSNGTIEYADQA